MVSGLCLAEPPVAGRLGESSQKTILFISSYHPGFPTFFPQIKGLRDILAPASIKFDIEFMDAKRFFSEEDQQIFYDSLRKKLHQLPRYDLVLTGDDAALHFIDKHRQELFPDQPIVFFGLNDIPYALSFDADPQITGVVEQISIIDTVHVMQKWFCKQSPFMLITDVTESGQANLLQFQQEMAALGIDQYKLFSLSDYRFDELNEHLRQLETPCAILPLSLYRDYTGNTQEFEESFQDIRRSTSAPIFHLWYHGMGSGVLGGKLVSHRQQAKTAATIALQLLQGKVTPTLPILRASPNMFVFDYNEMQRHGLRIEDLPKHSRVINKPDPLHRRYRMYMLMLIGVAGTLIIVVMAQMIRAYQRGKSQKHMLTINRELEEKVSQRTQALELARQETERMLQMRDTILDNSVVAIVLMKRRRIEWINHYAEQMFGYTREEVVGSASKFVYLSNEDFEMLDREAPPLLRKGQSYQAEFPFLRKDATIWWGMISGKAINPEHLEEGILFIIVDITPRKIAENQLKELNVLLENQATTDHLTCISNRRHISALINAEISRSNRYSQAFSVILIDVDHFKLINDTHGHDTGDRVLQGIANLLRGTCREVDTVARWGGEEFLVLCPKTSLNDAIRLAELLRERIEQCNFDLQQCVTASFGVAWRDNGQTLDELLSAADTALYKAKEQRNCVRY